MSRRCFTEERRDIARKTRNRLIGRELSEFVVTPLAGRYNPGSSRSLYSWRRERASGSGTGGCSEKRRREACEERQARRGREDGRGGARRDEAENKEETDGETSGGGIREGVKEPEKDARHRLGERKTGPPTSLRAIVRGRRSVL